MTRKRNKKRKTKGNKKNNKQKHKRVVYRKLHFHKVGHYAYKRHL